MVVISPAGPSMVAQDTGIFGEGWGVFVIGCCGPPSADVDHLGSHSWPGTGDLCSGEEAGKLVSLSGPKAAGGTRVHFPHPGVLPSESRTIFSGLKTTSLRLKPGEQFHCCSAHELPQLIKLGGPAAQHLVSFEALPSLGDGPEITQPNFLIKAR